MSESNDTSLFVYDYLMRKNLKNIGFTFSADKLTELDAILYTFCESEFNRIENDDRKHASKKR